MNYFKDRLAEAKPETTLESQVNDVIDDWHMNYQGSLSLSEFLAAQMNWTDMQARAWLAGKGFNATD